MARYTNIACALLTALALPGTTFAQSAQTYPTKPIRLVVPSSPGGGTDIVGRLIGQGLSESWGQSVVVDNRGGSGGMVGVAMVAKSSSPDGYTMLLGSNGHLSFAAAVNRNLPYDTQKDLAPVSLVANQNFVVIVHPSIPASSMRELAALAKARPGALSYGSGGAGSATHLGTELLQSMTGMSLLHVPYKGSGPALSALMSGEVQVVLTALAAALPHMKGGRIKVLAVTGAKRSAVAPDLPTVAEAGIAGYEFDVWYGLVFPAGTAPVIVMKTNAEILRLLKSPALAERFSAAGIEPLGSTPAEFADLIRREVPKWQRVVKDANIHVE